MKWETVIALGIENTVAVVKEGARPPSDIDGLTQIRFPTGRLLDVEDKIVEAPGQRRQAFELRIGRG
jgi:hypothetical protein